MNVVEGRLVESKIKGENGEKSAGGRTKKMGGKGTLVVDDDDSVSYLARIVA